MRRKFTCYRCGKYVEAEMDTDGDATCPACENVIGLEPERKLQNRIAELEEENDRLQDGWFRDETICPDGSLRPKVGDLLNRIAELSQAVGLITTLKPTMVMDANHPLDMVREVGEHVTARIAELEAENNRLAELLHNELSSLEIATDLGNKRWTALNKIYEDGEKHNTNWCKRIAQKGLGLK